MSDNPATDVLTSGTGGESINHCSHLSEHGRRVLTTVLTSRARREEEY